MQHDYKNQLTDWVKYREEIQFAIDLLERDGRPYIVVENKDSSKAPQDWVAIFVPDLEGKK